MKMCQKHWDALREAITARGLSALVAEDGHRAATNVVDELKNGRTLDNYDPLMAAHWALVGNCMETLGRTAGPQAVAAVMFDHDPSGGCPLCALNDAFNSRMGPDGRCTCGCGDPRVATRDQYDAWIDRAADDQVEAWKALKP